MDKTQQQIKIAEACGWQIQHDGPGGGYCGLHPKKHSPDDNPCPLPDYLNDLNAIHEAEGKLTLGQSAGYISNLSVLMPCREWNKIALIRATAAQRAEAFLRTLGLWEEGV